MKHLKLLLGIVLYISTHNVSAATLQVNLDGLLTGALNVDVSGTLYDVEFIDDSFDNVFGLTGAGIVASTLSQAQAFSNALLNQVLIDGIAGNFDTDQAATFGCGGFACQIYTPTTQSPWDGTATSNVPFYAAANFASEASDNAIGGVLLRGQANGFQSNTFNVWADWSLSPASPVPLPAAFWLFASGIIGLLTVSRRKSLI
jgi:hypothetical protein